MGPRSQRLARERRSGCSRVTARGGGCSPNPARRPISAAAQPLSSGPRSHPGKAPVPAVASPGAVLKNGRLAGLWRAKAKGKKAEISVEKLGHLTRNDLRDEVQRVAHLRGSPEHLLVVD
ncbi:MAG TPA: crosslink repair DNA glycosylase YcaQ family protein [Thermoleophilaceae bacterium]|nr:crosslink repair DNA glycosylase YcaQ family protein [Thermoleophilaceae bacterium]